jgi:hypothetical protein
VSSEQLYLVEWSDDGHGWWVVWDDDGDRKVPAAYEFEIDADKRLDEMSDLFPEASYRVVAYVRTSKSQRAG